MSNAITITGSTYTITGTVTNQDNNEGVVDVHVLGYDHDRLSKDDFLGIAVTDTTGTFVLTFDSSQFKTLLDRAPDLYFIVKDGGTVLLDTKDAFIKNADTSTPAIKLEVDLSGDLLRKDINPTPVDGWKGGFAESNPAFAYPNPDLSSLDMLDNLDNIDKLQRQQKVVWPEFSWETKPGEADSMRCYQMFAPDISRLGYTNEGQVFSIICPQQGAASPHIGAMNVEVTVTGNRGWANESNKEIAADLTVEPKIWFSPSAEHNEFFKLIKAHFNENDLPFPSSKANAIRIKTFNPGQPDHPIFSLTKGPSTDFPIPDFAKHETLSWSLGHLSVEMGDIVLTGIDKVDRFNHMIMHIFNTASGNMLQKGNVLTWNVWFTAPEHVDQKEWADHAELWRHSIDADHGSPDGEGTLPRYFDGTEFKPLNELIKKELPIILEYIKDHI